MKDLLIRAKYEIERLRRQNEILKAKVDVMELFACVLHSEPARIAQGQEIDIAWQLEQQIDKLKDEYVFILERDVNGKPLYLHSWDCSNYCDYACNGAEGFKMAEKIKESEE